jgi:hypothetical protein
LFLINFSAWVAKLYTSHLPFRVQIPNPDRIRLGTWGRRSDQNKILTSLFSPQLDRRMSARFRSCDSIPECRRGDRSVACALPLAADLLQKVFPCQRTIFLRRYNIIMLVYSYIGFRKAG